MGPTGFRDKGQGCRPGRNLSARRGHTPRRGRLPCPLTQILVGPAPPADSGHGTRIPGPSQRDPSLPPPAPPREVSLSELRARGKRSLFVDHPSRPFRPQEIIKHPSASCPRSYGRSASGVQHGAPATPPPSPLPLPPPFLCNPLPSLRTHSNAGGRGEGGARRVKRPGRGTTLAVSSPRTELAFE